MKMPLFPAKILALSLFASVLCYQAARAQTDVAYPADAGVYNVKNYGAIGDGTANDTTAFKTAIAAALNAGGSGPSAGRYGAIVILYIPNGTYLLDDTLHNWDGYTGTGVPVKGGWIAGMYLQGQSQSATILKLKDSAPGFTNASSPRAVIQTGSEDSPAVAIQKVTSITYSGTTATATCTAHGYQTGQIATISGATPSQYDGSFVITVTGANTFTYTMASSPGANATGSIQCYAYKKVTSITYSGTTATATSTAHGYETGQVVTITGASPSQYNGNFVVTVTGANTFTYTMASSPGANATGTLQSYAYTGTGNEAFRHYIRNLTVDVGTGNAGAIGIDYLVSNRGGIYNVTIKSSDPTYAGYAGLAMQRSWPGPGIVKNVTITGFATGIAMRSSAQYSMTLNNVSLSHQTSYGIDNSQNTLSIEGLTSSNSCPVYYGETATTHLTLLNGTFTGGISGNNAITGSGRVYCRNVTSTGYGYVISNTNGMNVTGGASKVTVPEYESETTYKGFSGNINGSIQLPIEGTPDFNDTNLADWENAATAGDAGSGGDYLNAIQTAIDAGKPVVYLPRGIYAVSNTIHLRGNVRKFAGCCAELKAGTGFPSGAPLIQYDGNGGTIPYADIQNIRIDGNIVHNCGQDLVLENDDLRGTYTNTSSGLGALFTEDTTGGAINIAYPQYFWARQLNIENIASAAFFTNHGGVAWIFGFKTEDYTGNGSIIDNENNGWTELLGGFFYLINPQTVPLILNNHSHLSANYTLDPYGSSSVPEEIQDVQSTTYNFVNSNCPLYSGSSILFPAPAILGNYTFAGGSVASSDNDPNSTASNFLNGSGYTNTVVTAGGQDQVVGPGISGDTAAQDYAAGEYFSFTSTANSGKSLYLSFLDLTVTRSQSSPGLCTVFAVPNGGPNSGQLLTVVDGVAVAGNSNLSYEADLTGPAFQGVHSVSVYIVFHGDNQGLGKDDVGPVRLSGTAQ